MSKYDYAIVGGGIVGLSTALALKKREPHSRIVVLEKENHVGAHQTGHNSGVIHSGIYYKPGSLKARFCAAGSRSMAMFCTEHGIAHEICGKLIVATAPGELPRLESLLERGRSNGLELRRLGPSEIKEFEPHVEGLAAIHVPSTGIVNYRHVAETYARLFQERGGELRLESEVRSVRETARHAEIESNGGTITAERIINCAGLQSDRMARRAGVKTNFRIVPFRGEYFELRPDRRYLVKNLIYPVPDPDFPFLGVHFTRMIDGSVHAGPNAVLSLKREGYRKTDFLLADTLDVLSFPGFWRLAARHFGDGMQEVLRSFSKRLFLRSLQRLIPEVKLDDLVPTHAGVRAQALRPDGGLVDDFLILAGKRSVHVCNAPSPAATASLEIGEAVADRIAEVYQLELA